MKKSKSKKLHAPIETHICVHMCEGIEPGPALYEFTALVVQPRTQRAREVGDLQPIKECVKGKLGIISKTISELGQRYRTYIPILSFYYSRLGSWDSLIYGWPKNDQELN